MARSCSVAVSAHVPTPALSCTRPYYACPVCQWGTEAVRQLRGAVYKGDGSVVELVRGRLSDDVLQMAGDGLLDAVAQGVDGAEELASHCAAALRDRFWVGDDELADQLEAALGRGAIRLLRPLAVDVGNWRHSWKAIRSTAKLGSISNPARSGLRATTSKRMTKQTTTAAGYTYITKVHTTAIAIWSGSSPRWRTPRSLIASRSR
jgi:hypothetical protein